MGKVRATFVARDVLHRGLTALQEAGVRDDQITIREQRPRTGEPGFEYVDEADEAVHGRMLGEGDTTMAATGANLVGSPAVPTTDSDLGQLLEAMVQREAGEERPEYKAGTRFEVTVDTDDPGEIKAVMSDNGGRDVKVIT